MRWSALILSRPNKVTLAIGSTPVPVKSAMDTLVTSRCLATSPQTKESHKLFSNNLLFLVSTQNSGGASLLESGIADKCHDK